MPLLLGLSFVLQFICLVHMVRTGRPYWWLWLIMLGSYLGVAVYFFTQILPDLQRNPAARRAVRDVQRRIDPERERRQRAAQLELADTVANRARLAEESLAMGDFDSAEQQYRACLAGHDQTAPDLLLGLARAQFGRNDFAAVKATLDLLKEANPTYRSTDGHLLYARSLEALGDSESALSEYAVLADYYPGEEARVRYGLLLKRCGRLAEARPVLERVLSRSKLAPRHYQRDNREWIERARSELG